MKEPTIADLESKVKRLQKALKPFADRVFNDNGDMWISDQHTLSFDNFADAYFSMWTTEGFASSFKPASTMGEKVYISGPMTGLPNFNHDVFHAQAARLRAEGFHVENPAENPKCESWQGYMRLAVIQVAQCDWMLMLPGWQRSKGAYIEYQLAVQLGLGIVFLDDGPIEIDVYD